jgi:hypothetical protein
LDKDIYEERAVAVKVILTQAKNKIRDWVWWRWNGLDYDIRIRILDDMFC